MSAEIGELLEEPGEMRGLWRIPEFPSLLEGEKKIYVSPKFLFLDVCWMWSIIAFKEKGWIKLRLHKMFCDSSQEVNFSFSIRNASGKEEKTVRASATFSKSSGWCEVEFLRVSDLQNRRSELAPSDVLTIFYTLKRADQSPSEGFLFRRLWGVSLSLRNILSTKKRSDVTLKLQDGKLEAHKMILGLRSPVFDRMLDFDLRESQTGEVNIEDATKDAFQVALSYAYTGDPEGLSCENVCEVYKIAHKYEFEDLRKLCTKFMQETLSVDTVCDVVKVVDVYQETALKECVRDFFLKNKNDIFKTTAWKRLKKDNPSIVFEVFEWMVGEEI